MTSNRPESIVRFECFALLAIVVAIVGRERTMFTIDLLGDIFLPVLLLWLTFRITRRQNLGARSIYTVIWGVLFLAGAYTYATDEFRAAEGVGAVLLTIIVSFQLISLWTPSSSEWLRDAPKPLASKAT